LRPQPIHSSLDTTDISVADVFEFVKQNNARFERDSKYPTKFTPNPTSAVVNDDSTPKVMYHGTGSEFWGFDKSKANAMTGRRMGLGAGKGEFYLTEHKGSAMQRHTW